MSYAKGKYSIERLVHFSCWKCKKWWTIGDAIINNTILYSCPHCNTSQRFEPAPPTLRESIEIEAHTVVEAIPPMEIEDASSVCDTGGLQQDHHGGTEGSGEGQGGSGDVSSVPPSPPWE